MLASLKQFFNSNTNDNNQMDAEHALRLAAATLMVEVSRSDGDVSEQELDTLGNWLEQEFELSESEVKELTQQAKQASDDAISLQGFTRQICERWGPEQRQNLVKYCWLIALLDQHLDAHERHTVRKIAGLLHLNDKETILAKEAATQALRN